MKVRMDTIVVDDEFRRRLNIYVGRPGLATRKEVKSWYVSNGRSCNVDLQSETDEIWQEENGE